ARGFGRSLRRLLDPPPPSARAFRRDRVHGGRPRQRDRQSRRAYRARAALSRDVAALFRRCRAAFRGRAGSGGLAGGRVEALALPTRRREPSPAGSRDPLPPAIVKMLQVHRGSTSARSSRRGGTMSNLAVTAASKPRQRRRTIIVDGPHPIDLYVGSRIRLQRVMRGLTQSELAKLVGISFQSVQKYERGENRVSASRLHEFATALGVNEQFFFDGLGGEVAAPAAGAPEPALSALEGKELQRQLAAVMGIEDKRLRGLIIQLLRALTEIAAARLDGGQSAELPQASEPA